METPFNSYNNLGGDASATVFFIIEEAKVAFLDFSQGTVKVFYFYFLSIFNTIWDKVSADIIKGFDSGPVYKKDYLKTKIKSHDEVTDF